MNKRTKNIWISAGIAAAGAVVIGAAYHGSAKHLMKLALDREAPKSVDREKEKMLGSKDFADIWNKVLESAGVLENSDCERVEIAGHDGVRLVGHWHTCETPKRVLVAMHGWRSSWSQDFGTIADFWFQNDCCVLFAEQRGQGGSGGEYMGFGLLERYDCLDWIHWVNERIGGRLPIYLGGVSMGGTTVLMTAGFALPDNVRGIVADCAFTSPHAIWKHVAEHNFHVPYSLYGAVAKDICKRKIQVSADAYSCVDAMRQCRVPVLFVHGTDDRFVPVDMTYENYKACAAPKRLFIVPGAEHGMSYLVDQEGYQTAVKQFWQDYDG